MDREELASLWRARLAEAASQLRLARNFLKEVRLSGDLAQWERAIQAESAAHVEYLRVFRFYEVLVLEVPEERRKAAGAA